MVTAAVKIGRAVMRDLFKRQVLVVPNCTWTGHEADLLVITPNLRVIDVEIKRTHADLLRDLGKDKWWHKPDWRGGRATEPHRWPPRVWKHWFVVDAAGWREASLDRLPPASGVAIYHEKWRGQSGPHFKIVRAPKPNREAKPISAVDAVGIARLASLRLWDEYNRQEVRPRRRSRLHETM